MKALTIDFDCIEQSMRDLCRESDDYYLDKTTGRILSLSRDLIRSLVEDGYEHRSRLPEWDSKMIPVARDIVLVGSSRYARIPEAFGRPEHHWRVAFAEDVRSAKLQQKLLLALKGRGSCHRFKEILKENPEEVRRWTMFRAHAWKGRIQNWLESLGILAIDQHPNKPRATAK